MFFLFFVIIDIEIKSYSGSAVMDILYTTNKKYIDMMLASIYSVYLNGGIEHLTLHIVYSDFSIDDILYIERFLGNLNNVDFHFYYLDEREIEKYHIPKWRGSYIANARLFFQSILKDKIPKKLLYIDADTICVDDLSGIINYSDAAVYAVKDSLHRAYTQRFMPLDKYFNSGVLYIDSKKWDKFNVEERIIYFIENNPWELVYPDQDIFNCALESDIGEMSVEYNFPPHVFLFNEMELRRYHAYRETSAEEILAAKDKIKICHSCGISGIKPWSNNNVNPYNELFMEYLMHVNPMFKKEELSLKEMLLTCNKRFYKEWLLFRNSVSSLMVVERGVKKKSLSNNINFDIKK